MNNPTEAMQLARLEAIAQQQRAAMPDVLEDALKAAVEAHDTETAASIARTIRNQLLNNTDARVALDRLGLVVPSGATFTAWLEFLRGIGKALTGEWAHYRQALRDLTAPPGFPLEIEWPTPPEDGQPNE